MKFAMDYSLLSRFRQAQRAAGASALWLGVLGLLGWIGNIALFKSGWPGRVPMAPATAYGLILAGAALWGWRAESVSERRWWWRSVGALLGLSGFSVVVLNGLAVYPSVVQTGWAAVWLFGRMTARLAGSTAWCFVLVGTALSLLPSGRWWTRLGQWLALAAACIAFVVLTGYLFGHVALAGQGGMAPNTALAFQLLSLGLLCARPTDGLIKLVASAGPGGTLLRVLLPVLLCTHWGLHWLTEAGTLAGWYAPAWEAPLFAVVSLVVTSTLVWLAARWLERSHHAQQAAELRFTQAFDLSPLALTITKVADGRLVEVNETLLRLTGYTRAELLGRTPVEAGLWADPAEHARRRPDLLQGETVQENEARFRMKDGSERVWLISASRIEYAGQPCLLSIMSDITVRKEAELALRDNEARLRLAIEAAQLSTWELRLKERQRILGENYAEVVGAAPAAPEEFLALIHPADRARFQAALTATLEQGVPYNLEYRVQLPNGETRWLASQGRVVFDAAGAPEALLGVVANVTARHTAEAARAQLAAIVESSAAAIYSYDFEGRLLTWNKGAEQLYGWTAAEILGQPVTQIIPLERADEPQTYFIPAIQRGEAAVNLETVRLRRDGTCFDALLAASPIKDVAGQAVALSIIVHDISEQKQAAEVLRGRNQQLTLLAQISQRLILSEEPDTNVLQAIFAEVGAALGLELFFHYQLGEQPGTLRLTAVGGFTAAQCAAFATIRFDQYLCGLVAEERTRLVIEDLGQSTHPRAKDLRAAKVRCYAGVPLIAHGQLLGTTAFATRQRTHLREGELQLIQTVCDLIASRLARARSQHLLRESAERLQLAAQTAGFGVHDYDVQSDHAVWSAEMYAILGLPAETNINLETTLATLHPADRPRIAAAMQAALDPAGTGEFDEEFRICRVDTGETRWVSNRCRTFFSEDGQPRQPLRNTGVLIDITTHKEAEAVLARYRLLSEHARDILLFVGRDGRIIEANRAAVEAYGYAYDELLTRHVRELRAPQFADEVEAQLQQAFERGLLFETWHRRRDGALFPVEVSARAVGAGADRIVLSIIRDITERKRVEEELRESRAFLARITSIAPTILYVYDLDETRNVWVNQDMYATLGYTAEEVQDFKAELLPRLLHPDDAHRYAAHYERLRRLKPEEAVEFEYRMRHRDGGWRWLCSFEMAFAFEEGVVTQIIGAAQDVTARKAAEADLRESEEKFRTLADNMSQFAWMADETGWIFWYNQRWYDYTGTTLDEVQGWGWKKVHHPDHVERVAAKIQKSWDTGEIWEDTFPLRSATGEYRWFLSRALPIRDGAGRIVRWFGTNTDITERKVAEAERERLLQQEQRAREAAESATRAKDEFIAIVSHELRSPLNTILGYTRMLRQPAALDAATHTKYADIIEQSARRQLRLIEDLLDTARIVRGKLRLEWQSCDFAQLVYETLAAIQPTAEAKGVAVLAEVTSPLDPLTCDPERLQQIVWNLLSNAVKFTPAEGAVLVRLRQVDGQAQLTVTDTGQGIDPEVLPYVFELFRQADSSSTRRHGGLGLGLSLVKQLTELHGGTITVTSAGAGQGATFTLRLPLRRPAGALPGEEREPVQPAREVTIPASQLLTGLRVLLVDDEAAAREIVTSMLQAQGAQVIPLASTAAALTLLGNPAQKLPDVLVADIGMPDEDGYALLRQVRARGLRLPAVALTAFGRTEDRLQALSAGFQMHVAKPVEPDELVMVLASLTGWLNKAGTQTAGE